MALYEKMAEQFNNWHRSNVKAQSLWRKVEEGKATYKEATEYSSLVGQGWSKVLLDNCKGAKSIDDIDEDVQMALKKAYSQSAYYSKNVQKLVNDRAGIGMRALEPAVNQNRIDGILERLAEGATDGKVLNDNTDWLLGKDVVENITRSAVSDTIEYNARKQTEAGLVSYIEREPGPGGCCEWCQSMAGRYVYGEQPSDFFLVHKDCNCVITYRPAKRRAEQITFTTRNGQRTRNVRRL